MVGRLEQARAIQGGAGEGPPDVAEQLAFQQGFGDGAAVDGDEGSRGPDRFLVHDPGDALLARAALARDEHGGIHGRHPPGQVQDPAHGLALGHDPQERLGQVGHDLHQDPLLLPQLPLGGLQALGDPVQGHLQAVLERGRFEKPQLMGALIPPALPGAPEQVAGGVTVAHAAILQHEDLLAGGPAQVAADEAADGPAHGTFRAAEMEQVLLGLVGRGQQDSLPGQGVPAAGVHLEHAFQGMQPHGRVPPLRVVVPLEFGAQGFGHPPAVGEAELGEHGAGRQQAEVLHEVLAQKAHGHRVQQDRALPGEADDAAVRIQLEQFLVIQVGGAHGLPLVALGQRAAALSPKP